MTFYFLELAIYDRKELVLHRPVMVGKSTHINTLEQLHPYGHVPHGATALGRGVDSAGLHPGVRMLQLQATSRAS